MFERMLDKQNKPTLNEFAQYCGVCKSLFEKTNNYLLEGLGADCLLRFPYGNGYGWGMKYFKKSKHICDVFAEKDAFTVMLRLSNTQFEKVYNNVEDYSKEYIDKKYSCGEGGWIHYRVLTEQHLNDIKTLLQFKAQK